MKFCSTCGGSVSLAIPDGDNRERYVCNACDEIHYQNPKNVVGCLLEWQGKVLLCKRAIEPRYGYWTLPAGFMENNETVMEGAAREAFEEAHAMFAGRLKDGYAAAGEETLEVKMFDESEIPWKELAFPVVVETLKRYFERRDERSNDVYLADITSRPGARIDIVRHS